MSISVNGEKENKKKKKKNNGPEKNTSNQSKFSPNDI